MKAITQGSEAAAVTLSSAAFYSEIMDVLFELRWMILLITVLVISDFVLGLTASVRLRGEDFRFSRAGRRTSAKLMEHFQYLLWGLLLGKAIFEPLGLCGHVTACALAACLPVVWEADSIAGHICDLHGIKARFSIKRIIIRLIKRKIPEIGDAVEEAAGEKEKDDNR